MQTIKNLKIFDRIIHLPFLFFALCNLQCNLNLKSFIIFMIIKIQIYFFFNI